MKYAYAFLAALLLVGASAFPLNLDDDEHLNELDYHIIDFLKLIPQEELQRVVDEHATDPEVWKTLKYLLSNDFHQLLYAAEDLPEFHRYVLYLQAAGYNVIRDLRLTHKSLGMKDYVPPKPQTGEVMTDMKKGGGLSGYFDDLVAILPKKEIQKLHVKKLKESPAFAKFIKALLSPELAQIKINLYSQKAMQSLIQNSKANGFDLIKIHNFKNQLIGFSP